MKAYGLYCLVAYSLPKSKLYVNESDANATLALMSYECIIISI